MSGLDKCYKPLDHFSVIPKGLKYLYLTLISSRKITPFCKYLNPKHFTLWPQKTSSATILSMKQNINQDNKYEVGVEIWISKPNNLTNAPIIVFHIYYQKTTCIKYNFVKEQSIYTHIFLSRIKQLNHLTKRSVNHQLSIKFSNKKILNLH